MSGRDEFRFGRTCGRAACAWCDTDLGERADIPDGETTHGICPDCSGVVFAEALAAHRERCNGWTHPAHSPDLSPCEICNPDGRRQPR